MRKTPWEAKREDIGWLAGIIDGEGSIYAEEKDTYPHFRYSFQIVNTNLEMLEKFQSIVRKICNDDGQFTVVKKFYRTGFASIHGKKQCYALQIRRIDDLKGMLTAVLPHLTEKREKATYLLSVLNTHKKFARYKSEKLAPVETKRVTPEQG